MTDMNINDFVKQFKAMQEENSRLKVVSQNYIEHANKLKQVAEELITIAKDLDPYMKTRESSDMDYGTVVNDVFDKMKSGTSVDSRLLATMYNATPNQVAYLMIKLKTMPGVKTRKEGVRLFLYYG